MTETRSDEDYVRDALRRLNPEFHRSDASWEALDRLVAQHRDTQEALAETEARLELALSLMNRDIEAQYEDGLDAALASVRARTPA